MDRTVEGWPVDRRPARVSRQASAPGLSVSRNASHEKCCEISPHCCGRGKGAGMNTNKILINIFPPVFGAPSVCVWDRRHRQGARQHQRAAAMWQHGGARVLRKLGCRLGQVGEMGFFGIFGPPPPFLLVSSIHAGYLTGFRSHGTSGPSVSRTSLSPTPSTLTSPASAAPFYDSANTHENKFDHAVVGGG